MKVSYLIIAVGLLIASCKNKDKELEQRVGALEEKTSSEQPNVPNNENIVSTSENKPEGPLPTIEFKESSFDFGSVKEGEKVKHTFEFTNTGDAPLIIQNASATCGCTVPDWPKDPIKPGDTGKIDVVFDSKGKSGTQSKTISVTANTYPSVTTVTLSGVVESTADDSKGPLKN